MSGKTPQEQVTIASHSFYTESPPKKSRLQEFQNIRPPFKSFKDKLVNFDKKLAEPIKTEEPKLEPVTSTDGGDENKNLDRESPLPLKNLGNTCYENSIIQCLFSLDTFMQNFERSMEEIRWFTEANNKVKQQKQQQEDERMKDWPALDGANKNPPSEAPTLTDDDVRFRITDAFDNLYKEYSYMRKQSESTALSTRDVSSSTPTVDGQQDEPSKSEEAHTLTPIALVSSQEVTTSGQTEVETRLENLKSAVGERSSQFNSTHQQDASEFFYHVIDSIQEFYQGLNKTSEEDNPVTKAFELELDYTTRCPKCHHEITSEAEKIRTLPLVLPQINSESQANQEDQPHNDISRIPTPPTSDLGLDSPESNTSEEMRSASEEKENQALTHESNHSSSNSENQSNSNTNSSMSISKLDLTDKVELNSNREAQSPKPNYTLDDALNQCFKEEILECKCSQPGCDSMQRAKRCLIKKLPQILFITLARYSYTGKKNLDMVETPLDLTVPFQENKSPSCLSDDYIDSTDSANSYKLVAVVCHLGSSLNAGHYTSYVYNQKNFSWYSCDDDSITKVQESEVRNDASKSGYCFFYAHESLIAQPEKMSHRIVADSSVVLTPESSPSPIRYQDSVDLDHDNIFAVN